MYDGFVRVAACVPEVRVADVAFNVERCIEKIRQAAGQGAKVVVLPELCLTAATCGDLFWQDALIDAAEAGVLQIAEATEDLDVLAIVGSPFRAGAKLYNCAFVLSQGEVVGIVPKRTLSHAEQRFFAAGSAEAMPAELIADYVPFGGNQLFSCDSLPELRVAVELGEDLWAPAAPSISHTLAGATLVVNLSARPALVGAAERTRALVVGQSGRLSCAYMLANAGTGESTTDAVYGGQCVVAQLGHLLAEAPSFGEGIAVAVVDVDAICTTRRRSQSFDADLYEGSYLESDFSLDLTETALLGAIDAHPFIPDDDSQRTSRCEEIFGIQAHALAGRLSAIHCEKVVIGISGGLDSTLAMLVAARAFDLLELDHAGILAITMPGFGTTDRTHNNAWQLALALGATPREIAIGASVRQHFADIDHDEAVHNAAYENAQARERTQILMDVANDIGGLVVGTGDLSELALGWATYNGDHMSMYGVNGAIPKTLVRYLVRHVADTCGNARESEVLLDVLDTPVSPELLPANADGTIAQQTEDLVGPYELHDFFVYHVLRWGRRPRKLYRLACAAFAGTYDEETVAKWLKVFYRRFFSQQFKRSCSPDGPAVGSVGLSPRGGLVMPSDASSALWLAELEEL